MNTAFDGQPVIRYDPRRIVMASSGLPPDKFRAFVDLARRREQAESKLSPEDKARYDAALASTSALLASLKNELAERLENDLQNETRRRVDRGIPENEARTRASESIDKRNKTWLEEVHRKGRAKADSILFGHEYDKEK